MTEVEKEVTEGVGDIVLTVQRTGDIVSPLDVYCYIAPGNTYLTIEIYIICLRTLTWDGTRSIQHNLLHSQEL